MDGLERNRYTLLIGGLAIQAGVLATAILIDPINALAVSALMLVVAVFSVATSAALAVTIAREGSPRTARPMLWIQFVVQLLFALGLATFAIERGLEVSAFGPARGAWWILALIILAGVVSTACARVLLPAVMKGTRRSFPRTIYTVGAVLIGVVVLGGIAASIVQTQEVGCGHFSFDREQWDRGQQNGDESEISGRERIADALLSCETLVGKSREYVREQLGGDARAQTFYVGVVNDSFGPGDAQYLLVRYDEGEVVKSVGLSYPADW